ncbi:MAG TPA: DNA polymerase IV [Chloroflexota bacterium]|nr:DNA polymerase IV [Chloroflexota bacterium]
MIPTPSRRILHMDLDAMFASVEVLQDPALQGLPVIVGARPGSRGVVSTCGYEARAFGVHSAMPIGEAYARCPQGVFLPVRMELYREYSARVFAVLSRYASRIQPLSIDEAFADLSDTDDPTGLAREVKAAVRQDTGLVASMGLATSKLVAKIATGRGKPDGFVVVKPGQEAEFLAPLPAGELWGVGPKTAGRLEEAGIRTVGQLASADPAQMAGLVGPSAARELMRHALGLDDSPVQTDREVKSISDETTFQRDEAGREALWRVLTQQAASCARRLEEEGLRARTITVKMRFSDFQTVTRSITLECPTGDPAEIAGVAGGLMRRHWSSDCRPLRLLGLRVSGLERGTQWVQLRLPLP